MSRPYSREKELAIGAVRQAAALCRAVQADLAASALEKADRSPVTVADFASQALVCRALAGAFPDDPVMAEEGSSALRQAENAAVLEKVARFVGQFHPGAERAEICQWIDRGAADRYSGRFWALDPIDGTKGFLRGGQYAVALALVVEGQVAVAAVACPSLPLVPGAGEPVGTLFVAVGGEGVSMVPLDGDGEETSIHVDLPGESAQVRFCESVESRHSSQADAARVAQRLGITQPPLRLDSQAKYGVVARGEAHIYLRLPTREHYVEKIWDHAAGSLVVTEAGGVVSDMAGKPLEFHHGRELLANRGVVVTNGPLHEPVLEALAVLKLNP